MPVEIDVHLAVEQVHARLLDADQRLEIAAGRRVVVDAADAAGPGRDAADLAVLRDMPSAAPPAPPQKWKWVKVVISSPCPICRRENRRTVAGPSFLGGCKTATRTQAG